MSAADLADLEGAGPALVQCCNMLDLCPCLAEAREVVAGCSLQCSSCSAPCSVSAQQLQIDKLQPTVRQKHNSSTDTCCCTVAVWFWGQSSCLSTNHSLATAKGTAAADEQNAARRQTSTQLKAPAPLLLCCCCPCFWGRCNSLTADAQQLQRITAQCHVTTHESISSLVGVLQLLDSPLALGVQALSLLGLQHRPSSALLLPLQVLFEGAQLPSQSAGLHAYRGMLSTSWPTLQPPGIVQSMLGPWLPWLLSQPAQKGHK